MIWRVNTWILNFMLSGRFFDEKWKKTNNIEKTENNIYEWKMDYVNKVTGFLEKWIKEMKKDIKKF